MELWEEAHFDAGPFEITLDDLRPLFPPGPRLAKVTRVDPDGSETEVGTFEVKRFED